ncbi:MAG: Flp pilus assembly protein CpaB, partial [Acidimicrobiales bacterium]
MRRRVGGLIAALVLATAGTLALMGYVQSAKDEALAGEAMVVVLVVSQPVAKGTAANTMAGMVTTQRVPVKVRAAGAVTSLAPLKDLVAAVDLVPGEQVVT